MSSIPWLAAYLYYEEPWEDLLNQAVKPFVERILADQLADGFFFIRYWERGPHVRLRFHGDPTAMANRITPLLDDHFQGYFTAHPSERTEPEWLAKLPEDQQWYPNNSIHYITYEPELERYGGTTGILIAEKQFQHSSEAVLAVIEESREWGYERALGVAIQMHLAFAGALGMSLRELKGFFNMVSRGWFARAYYFDNETTKEEHEQRGEETRDAFAQTFEGQKEALIPFCRTLWNALEEGVEFEQEWLNGWIRGMEGIAAELVRKAGKIDFYEHFLYNKGELSEVAPMERRRFWPILESYIHMTNNRLGILNRDEAFLGFLIERTMNLI